MKRILLRTLLICMLAMLFILIPVLLHIDLDNKKSLLPYLASNQYIGRWVGSVVDRNGVLERKYYDRDVSKSYAVTIDQDGIMLLDTPDDSTAYELQKIDGGVCYYLHGLPYVAYMMDGWLVLANCEGAYDVYFTPCQDPVGTWEAVSYELQGRTFPAEKLFPDGCILTLHESGRGSATIDGKQTVRLHMQYQGGAFDGGGVFHDPRWDAQKGTLVLNYGQDTAVTFQRRITAKEGLSVNAVPPYYKDQPENGTPQNLQLHVFSIAFPKEGWINDMSELYDTADDGRLEYLYYDKNEHLRARFSIKAITTRALDYRDTLAEFQEITNKSVLDEIQIGGITFSCADYVYDDIHYMEYAARVPESQMNLNIRIEESMTGYDYKPILDSIAFTLPVLSPVPKDPPLPENSAPYVPRPSKVRIGGTEVKAAWLPMDTPLLVNGSTLNSWEIDNDILALHGDTLYALTGRRLYALQIKDGRLVKSPVFPEGVLKLEDKYMSVSMTENGILYVMDGKFKNFSVRDGVVTPINEWLGYLAMHPGGEWGIRRSTITFTDLSRFNISSMEMEDWALQYSDNSIKNAETLSIERYLLVYDDRVYIAGRLAGKGGVGAVGVFDLTGKELFIIGSANHALPYDLYEVADVVQTQKSIVILDGHDDLVLFSLSGDYIGTIDYNELLGTDYAEILSITPAEDGMILCATQIRDDLSCTELLVFHITGI